LKEPKLNNLFCATVHFRRVKEEVNIVVHLVVA
jgi:hypothetical protein